MLLEKYSQKQIITFVVLLIILDLYGLIRVLIESFLGNTLTKVNIVINYSFGKAGIFLLVVSIVIISWIIIKSKNLIEKKIIITVNLSLLLLALFGGHQNLFSIITYMCELGLDIYALLLIPRFYDNISKPTVTKAKHGLIVFYILIAIVVYLLVVFAHL